jgi:hypothetical protein
LHAEGIGDAFPRDRGAVSTILQKAKGSLALGRRPSRPDQAPVSLPHDLVRVYAVDAADGCEALLHGRDSATAFLRALIDSGDERPTIDGHPLI